VLAGRKAGLIVEDTEADWRTYLYNVIDDDLRTYPRIVVEGYLVEFALDELKAKLEKKVALHIVRAENQKYFIGNEEVTATTIANL
jgi:hypothetical protein